MTTEELIEKLNYIQKIKCETQTIELKSLSFGLFVLPPSGSNKAEL